VKLKRAGLSREAFDVGRETGKEYAKDPELAAVIYKALKGEVAFTAIENKKIRNGAVNIRSLFNEMRNDIVRYMALTEENPALAKKMLENTGYLPAKYEIFENPELLQIVADNIRKKGLNIERMGQRTYLWHALPEELVPPEILETKILNAGYLLGKQGPAVQADLTMAEIAWRTAAHPEWTLSDELAAGITKTLVGPQGKRRFRQIVHSPVSVRTKLVTKGKERALDVVEVRVVDAADPTKVVDDLGVMRRGRVNHNNIKRDYLPEPPPGYSAFREYGRDLIKTPDGKRYLKIKSDALGVAKDRYILEAIAQDMEATVQIPRGIARFLDAGTRVFKFSKVTLNPATLIRNVIGNIILADLGGVSPLRWDKYLKAMTDYFKQTPRYREGRRHGLIKGQWFGTEIKEILTETQKVRPEARNIFVSLGRWTSNKTAASIRQFGRFHEAAEQLSKRLMYNHARDSLGMTPQQAVAFAHKWIFDYQDVPRFVQVVRKSPVGIPFISFSYKALPRVVETALATGDPKKMLRFWKYPIGIGAYNEFSARELGLEGGPIFSKDTALRVIGTGMGVTMGEWGDIKKLQPHYAGNLQMLSHDQDIYDRFHLTDLSWMLPWGDFTESGAGPIGRQVAEMKMPYPRFLEPSGPWLQVGAGVMTGKDIFTGRDIVSPENKDTLSPRLRDWTGFIFRTFGPALLNPAGRSLEKVVRAYREEYKEDPYVPTLGVAIASEAGALKRRAIEPQTALRKKFRRQPYARSSMR
jgi:hypothetical protein